MPAAVCFLAGFSLNSSAHLDDKYHYGQFCRWSDGSPAHFYKSAIAYSVLDQHVLDLPPEFDGLSVLIYSSGESRKICFSLENAPTALCAIIFLLYHSGMQNLTFTDFTCKLEEFNRQAENDREFSNPKCQNNSSFGGL